MKSKSEFIRECVRARPDATNKEIKGYAKSRGVIVESNLIVSVVGSERERLGRFRYSESVMQKAESFIHLVGGYDAAKRLISLAAGGMKDV